MKAFTLVLFVSLAIGACYGQMSLNVKGFIISPYNSDSFLFMVGNNVELWSGPMDTRALFTLLNWQPLIMSGVLTQPLNNALILMAQGTHVSAKANGADQTPQYQWQFFPLSINGITCFTMVNQNQCLTVVGGGVAMAPCTANNNAQCWEVQEWY